MAETRMKEVDVRKKSVDKDYKFAAYLKWLVGDDHVVMSHTRELEDSTLEGYIAAGPMLDRRFVVTIREIR